MDLRETASKILFARKTAEPRCLGHEIAGEPHVLYSTNDCHPQGCLHISARIGATDEGGMPEQDFADLARYLGIRDLYTSSQSAPTFQGCRALFPGEDRLWE